MESPKKGLRCAAIAAAIFVGIVGVCVMANKAAAPVAIADIAATYTSYRKVTDSDVYVNPELAMLCRGASREEVEAAKIKHGPHAHTAILVYMNEPAAQVFSRGDKVYPAGSVIVKQKRILGFYDYKSGKNISRAENGVGGMVKRAAGYDPDHGDWEYFYFEDKSKIQAGRIQSCVQCHEGAKSTDYVFGTWRTAPATRVSAAGQ